MWLDAVGVGREESQDKHQDGQRSVHQTYPAETWMGTEISFGNPHTTYLSIPYLFFQCMQTSEHLGPQV